MNRSSRELRRARLRFAAVFVAVGGALLALYSFPYAEHGAREVGFAWYLGAYARVAGAVIHLADPTVRVSGADLVGRTSLTIAKNCDAMDVNLLLIGGTVSGVIGGIPAGTDYTLALTATYVVQKFTSCAGSSTVAVTAGATTPVSVAIECRLPPVATTTPPAVPVPMPAVALLAIALLAMGATATRRGGRR